MICIFWKVERNVAYYIIVYLSSYVLTKTLKVYVYNIVYVLFKQNNLLKDKLRTQLKVMFQSFTKQNCSAPIYFGGR